MKYKNLNEFIRAKGITSAGAGAIRKREDAPADEHDWQSDPFFNTAVRDKLNRQRKEDNKKQKEVK